MDIGDRDETSVFHHPDFVIWLEYMESVYTHKGLKPDANPQEIMYHTGAVDLVVKIRADYDEWLSRPVEVSSA